jgi:hypothetical protein
MNGVEGGPRIGFPHNSQGGIISANELRATSRLNLCRLTQDLRVPTLSMGNKGERGHGGA